MSTRRKHLGCAVFDNQIYAVGGRDDCTELSSAERYILTIIIDKAKQLTTTVRHIKM